MLKWNLQPVLDVSMKQHCCVRVYANLDRVVEWRDATRLPGWLEYNSVYRFGNALFVDGECKRTGYLSAEKCEELAAGIRQELADNKLRYSPNHSNAISSLGMSVKTDLRKKFVP